MYDVRPNLVIGFHGCDESICKGLLNNPNNLRISREPFDWLGHGMYFWENNYERAYKWAKEKQTRGRISNPSVVGAVLQLGYCCDFLDSKHIQMLRSYYNLMSATYRQSNTNLPINKDLPNDKFKDRILRELDCAVIEYMNTQIFNQVNQNEQKNSAPIVPSPMIECHGFSSSAAACT